MRLVDWLLNFDHDGDDEQGTSYPSCLEAYSSVFQHAVIDSGIAGREADRVGGRRRKQEIGLA